MLTPGTAVCSHARVSPARTVCKVAIPASPKPVENCACNGEADDDDSATRRINSSRTRAAGLTGGTPRNNSASAWVDWRAKSRHVAHSSKCASYAARSDSFNSSANNDATPAKSSHDGLRVMVKKLLPTQVDIDTLRFVTQ